MSTQLQPQGETQDLTHALGEFYLNRLARFVALQPTPGLLFDAERLLHHAIYATYMDCRDLGLEHEANALITRVE
jgi:hypothetical protein